MIAADELFGRHLDLKPLDGRRRGLVTCIFHPHDRNRSMSVDLDRGLFHCFACGVGGGVRKFAELVGEAPAPTSFCKRRGENSLAAARREVLELAGGQAWARSAVIAQYRNADELRAARRLGDSVRRAAVDPADDRMWDALAIAAEVDTDTELLEMELDDAGGGRW